MTKIKDLVTVQIDNAFLLFPIDTERYELRAATLNHWMYRESGTLGGFVVSRDDRVQDFIRTVEETFLRAARAAERVCRSTEISVSKGDTEMYNRVKAAVRIGFYHPRTFMSRGDTFVQYVTTALWREFTTRMFDPA